MELKEIRRKALNYLPLLAIGLFLLNWFYQTEPIVLTIPFEEPVKLVIKQVWATLFVPWAIFAVRFTYMHRIGMTKYTLYKKEVSETFVDVPDRTIAFWACPFSLLPIGLLIPQHEGNFLSMINGSFGEVVGGALFLMCIPWIISHIVGSMVHSRMGFVTFGPIFITPVFLVWGFVHFGPLGSVGIGFIGFVGAILISAMLSTLFLFIEVIFERIAEWPLWGKIKQGYSFMFVKQKPNQTQVTEG